MNEVEILRNQRDFTLQRYHILCQVLQRSNYQSISVSDYFTLSPDTLPEKFVLLRHDVDSRPKHALKLANIEREHQLKATYYFRTIRSVFDADTMQKLTEMGHEVGYHYETLGQTNGDISRAIELFGQELARLRKIVPITSASMHGSPLKPWDNRDIWQQVAPAEFDLLGEAYRDIDYEKVIYLNDTGRTWHPSRYNLRDYSSTPPKYTIDSTSDLIALIEQETIQQICISAHPERWQEELLMWSVQAMRDVAINWTKLLIKRLRT